MAETSTDSTRLSSPFTPARFRRAFGFGPLPLGMQANMRGLLRKLLPRRVVALVVALRAAWIFRRALNELVKLPPNEMPSDELLNALVRGWNNDNFVATPQYLRAVAESCAGATLPILECGSGLTTVVCAAIAARRGVEMWTLEHNCAWLARVRKATARIAPGSLHLLATPLRSYGEFDWYDAPIGRMPARFGLVICDGPPGTTRGGRYGLVPVLSARLVPGSLLLVDDAHREAERAIIENWAQLVPMNVTVERTGSRAFARIVLQQTKH